MIGACVATYLGDNRLKNEILKKITAHMMTTSNGSPYVSTLIYLYFSLFFQPFKFIFKTIGHLK